MKIHILTPLLIGLLLGLAACGPAPTSQVTRPADFSPTPAASLTATQAATATNVPATQVPATEAPAASDTPVNVLSGDVTVGIQASHCGPALMTVKSGTTVHWANNEDHEYILIANDGSFQSNILHKGDEFAFTFNIPGTFTYHCQVAGLIQGTIVVVP